MEKWMYFVMSLGSIFIVIYPTSEGSIEHLILGVLLMLVATITLVLNRKKKNKE